MKSEILKRAKEVIANRRIVAENRLELETAQARQKQEFCAIEQELKRSTYNISKAIGKGTDTRELELQNAEIINRLQSMKKSIGLANDYYTCHTCNDRGMLEDGSLCTCLKQVYYDLVREQSGIAKLPQITFASNRIDQIQCQQRDNLIRLYKSMENYCRLFPNNSTRNIILFGEVGSGKSYLMSAVANEILRRGFTVQYLSAYAMNSLFETYFFSDRNRRDEGIIASMVDADLLIIDDIGTEGIKKNITIELLQFIIDERVNKNTIMTTNLTPAELKSRYGERLFSRLCSKEFTTTISLIGDDLRIIKHN